MGSCTLVYLSYGGRDVQVAETKYAILSAFRSIRPADDIGILLYTDRPDLYADLPAAIRPISAGELEAWTGPGGYQYRRKAEVVKDALARTGNPVAFIDSDTWFVKSPALLFHRIGAGRTVLHVKEGTLGAAAYNAPLVEHLSKHAYANGLGATSAAWNSGVIGVDPADAHLMDEALALIDGIWADFQEADTLEQVAISHFFSTTTTVTAAADVVFHYWPLPLRKPFHATVVGEIERTQELAPSERAEALHPLRPRLRGVKRLKHLVKELYRATGRQWPNSIPGNAT